MTYQQHNLSTHTSVIKYGYYDLLFWMFDAAAKIDKPNKFK